MNILFVFINLVKILLLIFFVAINVDYEGSEGWAFQHLGFMWLLLLVFLPISFFEKSMLANKAFVFPFIYIPLLIVVINFLPWTFGLWRTKAFIVTQACGVLLAVFEVLIYFRPRLVKH